MTTTNPYIAKAASTTPQTPMSVWAKVLWMVVGAFAVAVALVIGTSIWGLNHINNAYELGKPVATSPGSTPGGHECKNGAALYRLSLNGSSAGQFAPESIGQGDASWKVLADLMYKGKSTTVDTLIVAAESTDKDRTVPRITQVYTWESVDGKDKPYEVSQFGTPEGGKASVMKSGLKLTLNDVVFACVDDAKKENP
jgi:hypothetical protein